MSYSHLLKTYFSCSHALQDQLRYKGYGESLQVASTGFDFFFLRRFWGAVWQIQAQVFMPVFCGLCRTVKSWIAILPSHFPSAILQVQFCALDFVRLLLREKALSFLLNTLRSGFNHMVFRRSQSCFCKSSPHQLLQSFPDLLYLDPLIILPAPFRDVILNHVFLTEVAPATLVIPVL